MARKTVLTGLMNPVVIFVQNVNVVQDTSSVIMEWVVLPRRNFAMDRMTVQMGRFTLWIRILL